MFGPSEVYGHLLIIDSLKDKLIFTPLLVAISQSLTDRNPAGSNGNGGFPSPQCGVFPPLPSTIILRGSFGYLGYVEVVTRVISPL